MELGDRTEKTCRYGHGKLKTEDGYWGFVRINHEKTGLIGAVKMTGPDFNSFLVACVLTCPVCGYIELSEAPPP